MYHRWRIYYCDREYAREQGDPCLGIVEAPDKRMAELAAERKGLGGWHAAGGLWAVEMRRETGERG